MGSAMLKDLPRLPETAAEVIAVAQALHADPDKDVFLGVDINDKAILGMPMADRKVVMFATHGLVPGDIDGLTQPALAMSHPDVTRIGNTGLLTMDNVLSLKLDADWVVLSACNTALGDATGSEALSGLGRAFFYAGTRAVLVTDWAVESGSAAAITTGLFKRAGDTPGLTRAEALRQTMLSLIDGPGAIDPQTGKVLFSYAHPLFWAPYALVGDGG
jgi:CHAT domain-containing protein